MRTAETECAHERTSATSRLRQLPFQLPPTALPWTGQPLPSEEFSDIPYYSSWQTCSSEHPRTPLLNSFPFFFRICSDEKPWRALAAAVTDSHRPQASGCHEASWQPTSAAGLPCPAGLLSFAAPSAAGRETRPAGLAQTLGAARPSSPGACRSRDETAGLGSGRARARGGARGVPAASRGSGSP